MSLLSSRLSLIHRCTIERDASEGTTNARGNAVAPSWQPLTTDLPCRVWVNAGQEAVDATTTAIVEDMRLFLTVDTDVTEQDRIGDVMLRGATYLVGPIGIRAVLRHHDHLELVLKRIS